jgi:ribonuclease H / adenosylcobalamin/alpha-ribazole phosphatase
MATLLLVRHGRAAGEGDLRLPGPDLPLLPEGVEQARAVAERLWKSHRPSAVFTSAAMRARQTGAIIAARCGVEVQTNATLREIDLGDWAGLTYAEAIAADPRAAAWFVDPAATSSPGGESLPDVAARMLDAFAEIANVGELSVVVGHAGSLRLALALALGMPLGDYWRLRLDCGSLSILDWTEAGPIVNAWNDRSHLATKSGPESAFDRPSGVCCHER